jgi:sec-independent protein translocase protein TatA
MPGPVELAIICGVLVLIFGPKQIPKMARSIGSSIVEFKKGVKGIEEAVSNETKEIKESLDE